MTIPEVNRHIQAWGWRREEEQKFFAMSFYRMPSLIAMAVLDGKKYPEIYDIYPNLFNKEDIEQARQEQEVKRSMEVFKAWAESYNMRQEKKLGE